MMKYKYITVVLLFIVYNAFAENCFPKRQNRLVVDDVGVLNRTQNESLNANLVDYSNRTSTQILVAIVKDLCGMDQAMYATELGHKWGVGQEDKDNGVVVLIKPMGGQGQRKVFVAVGYGLEGVIPDAIAKRIVENEMIPEFKNGDIYGGIVNAVGVIQKLASGEFSADNYMKKSKVKNVLPSFFIIIFFMFFIILSRISGARSYSRRNNIGFWTALFLMSSSGGRYRGHYGNFSSGSGSFGGFGGGGFGGFGGGGFGGGGAGGSW